MVSGHSYLPNDRDFGIIGSAKRRSQHIYVPHDWYDLVHNACRKNPFIHSGPWPINKAKLDDIISILPYIPPIHHDFHKNLQPTTAELDYDSKLSESNRE